MKNQNLDFELARDFFIKWTIMQFRIIWKNAGMLDFVILDIYLALSSYGLWYEITQHMHFVILLSFLKKRFVISLFCCRSAVVSQTKIDHI